MLLQGPRESASPRWLPTLLALGRGGCPVPVPVPRPCTSWPHHAERPALLRAGLPRADLAAGHTSACLIYMHNYRGLVQGICFPAGKLSAVIPLHLLHGLLLLLMPPAILTARRQAETALWVSSGEADPGEAMSASSSLFQSNSSDPGDGLSTTSPGR